MFFTADFERADGGAHGWCSCCRPGFGPCDGSTGPGDCPSGGLVAWASATYMSWTCYTESNPHPSPRLAAVERAFSRARQSPPERRDLV